MLLVVVVGVIATSLLVVEVGLQVAVVKALVMGLTEAAALIEGVGRLLMVVEVELVALA